MEAFAKLSEHFEKRIDAMRDELSGKFEIVLREELRKMHERWPRHEFKAAQAHGLLIWSTTPAICGTNNPEFLPEYKTRQAIADLVEWMDKIKDEHASMNWSLTTPETNGWVEREIAGISEN